MIDPHDIWKKMIGSLVNNNVEEASKNAVTLIEWLDQGGHCPQIIPELAQVQDDNDSLAYQLNRMIVTYACARVRRTL
jgi:hypothetical protein